MGLGTRYRFTHVWVWVFGLPLFVVGIFLIVMATDKNQSADVKPVFGALAGVLLICAIVCCFWTGEHYVTVGFDGVVIEQTVYGCFAPDPVRYPLDQIEKADMDGACAACGCGCGSSGDQDDCDCYRPVLVKTDRSRVNLYPYGACVESCVETTCPCFFNVKKKVESLNRDIESAKAGPAAQRAEQLKEKAVSKTKGLFSRLGFGGKGSGAGGTGGSAAAAPATPAPAPQPYYAPPAAQPPPAYAQPAAQPPPAYAPPPQAYTPAPYAPAAAAPPPMASKTAGYQAATY